MARLAASRLGLAAVLAALLLAAHSSSAQAAWPHDPNNGNVALCTAAGNQYNPAIVSDGAGGAIVTWYDQRSGVAHIYAQRVNAAGAPQWTADGVALCTAAGGQFYPVIESDGAGGAFVAWSDLRSGVSYDIYAQRVNAAGAPQWTLNGVALCTAALEQSFPTITSDGTGGAIVAWHDIRGGTSFDIYAQRVNASGVPLWTAEGVALCTPTNEQSYPAIASDGAGGAIVTWRDGRSGPNYDIYAQRVNAAGAPQWGLNGVALCTSTNDQTSPVIASDGSGGAIVTWYDLRSGTSYDVYAQRVNATGAYQWILNGLAICTAAGNQQSPAIASDGSGGAVIAWTDIRSGSTDIYAQRVIAAGVPQWTANGVAVCTAASNQTDPTISSDGAGGAIVAWQDFRTGVNNDIYAQKVNAAGAPQWTANGALLSSSAGDQLSPEIASDGSGGAIVTWYDGRSGVTYDIYAQRIERFGYLGNPEPTIASVRDVPNDNGGQVKVSWYPSWLDGESDFNLVAYDIYRSAPGSITELAVKQGAHLLSGFGETPAAAGRSFVIPTADANRSRAASPDAAELYAWEYVGTVNPAHFLPAYGYIAPTTGDSIGAGNPRTIFMVVGRNYNGSMYWLSAPDSGYSVDNLVPVTPAPFTAAYSFGATHLHWGVNHEGDLAGYRLYRGSSSSFVPGPGNLVSAQPDTGFTDVGAAGSWYKLSAVDIHGNESVYAILGPNGTLDAPGGGVVTALYFAPPSPNPTSGGTTLRFGLPREGAVTIRLFDQQGRRVKEIARGVMPAGDHRLIWDGRDEAGHVVPSGIYFAKLDHAGRSLVTRLMEIH